MINKESLKKLIQMVQGDDEIIEFIQGCLKSFYEYHHAIYDMETSLMLHNFKKMEQEEMQSFYSKMDWNRRSKHNMVISSVNMLNRLTEKYGILPFYEGTVSEEKPYRREIADAVLAYIEIVIKERR